MHRVSHIAARPSKPVMIFDGDCTFCRLWIRRWTQFTADRVEYLSFQDPAVAARFPELRRADLERAVHLVESDGATYQGAAAAFRALATNPKEAWLREWYERWPVFERSADWAYALVAGNRRFFSWITRLLWGSTLEKPTYQLTSWLFLRALAAIYLVAFASLGVQIKGLLGSNGILPAADTMPAIRQAMDSDPARAYSGIARFREVPTLCWLSTSDDFLAGQCLIGALLALVLLIGFAPAPCLFLLWLIYLSLTTIGGDFLAFQWDNLLLEAGFLAIFLAPLPLTPSLWRTAPPSGLVLWLIRWLLFRLMFASGCVKLLSGDAAWANNTALQFHYQTQPLPTWIGWYAHQLPPWVQEFSARGMFYTELIVPFLIFAPRRPRQLAGFLLIGLQLVIFLTGNYCFFNLLTVALCLTLFDDASLRAPKWQRRFGPSVAPGTSVEPSAAAPPRRLIAWPVGVTVPLALMVLLFSARQVTSMFHLNLPWPRPLRALQNWATPFRTCNSYGLFAVMTTNRAEIVVEGSDDGATWREYQFKYKPGDLNARPQFVEPHQPRLDWQMWFAALGDVRNNPWFLQFCIRLLQGKTEVTTLLERNPFPDKPPRYLRARLYDYRFTDSATRGSTGAWWRREPLRLYLPPISLRPEAVGGDERTPRK